MKRGSHTAVTTPGPGWLRLVEDRSLQERLAGSVSEQLGLFAERMREGLLAASVAIGLEVMGELVEAEVGELAGPKGKHDPGRSAYRHGSEAGRVTLGGRRVPVRRPRVRTVAGGWRRAEVRLESYDTFASVDLLAERMVASLLAGLSGRRYRQALEPVGEQLEASRRGRRRARSAAASSRRPRSGWPSSARVRSTASGG